MREKREAELRHAVRAAGTLGQETVLQYSAPSSDRSIVLLESVDFIFFVSVLEHVRDPDAVYQSCFLWLRPGGVMAHKIDYSSHGITRHWNGNYWIPDWLWRLVMGDRPYEINRWTPKDHRKAAVSAGFEVVSMDCQMVEGGSSPLCGQTPKG